jgi:hypothetical protein
MAGQRQRKMVRGLAKVDRGDKEMRAERKDRS